jgi:hypothetical protein
MKSPLEKRFSAQKESAEALIAAEFGDEASGFVFSFSELECVIDFKLGKTWVRYVLIDNEDEPDKLRQIG